MNYQSQRNNQTSSVDKRNKIPVLLNERYFEFQHDGNKDDENESVNENIREVKKEFGGSGSGEDVFNRINSPNRPIGMNRFTSSVEDLERRFRTIFCDDTSDEDNCNVQF